VLVDNASASKGSSKSACRELLLHSSCCSIPLRDRTGVLAMRFKEKLQKQKATLSSFWLLKLPVRLPVDLCMQMPAPAATNSTPLSFISMLWQTVLPQLY
jgi:hypothetical protein